jgi:hypothetical protein
VSNQKTPLHAWRREAHRKNLCNRSFAVLASPVDGASKRPLDTFQDDEVLDLAAYLLSRGDHNPGKFQQ